MAIAKEQLRQNIADNDINSVGDIYTLFKDSFKDMLQELLEAEMDSSIGFSDLDVETKKTIWSYEMSIVNLDKKFSIDEVRNMFYRLNLTDYSINEQEKRNSLDSIFGTISQNLANMQFWQDYKIFSATDIRRMKDIEYCSSILLLAREGIIDQTKGERLDQIYKELGEEYGDATVDLERNL